MTPVAFAWKVKPCKAARGRVYVHGSSHLPTGMSVLRCFLPPAKGHVTVYVYFTSTVKVGNSCWLPCSSVACTEFSANVISVDTMFGLPFINQTSACPGLPSWRWETAVSVRHDQACSPVDPHTNTERCDTDQACSTVDPHTNTDLMQCWPWYTWEQAEQLPCPICRRSPPEVL